MPAFAVLACLVPDNAFAQAARDQAPSQQGQPGEPPATTPFGETIAVVGVTPIHGLGVSRDKIPSNIQAVDANDLTRTDGIYFGEQLPSVFGSGSSIFSESPV